MNVVVAAVIERDGRILIAQRAAGGRHPLKWEFPGGKVEPGETLEEAVLRELAEELAIQARIQGEITRYEYQYPERPPILLIFYRIAGFSGEPRNLQFEQLRWELPECLQNYDFLEGDIRFIQSYTAADVSGPAEGGSPRPARRSDAAKGPDLSGRYWPD